MPRAAAKPGVLPRLLAFLLCTLLAAAAPRAFGQSLSWDPGQSGAQGNLGGSGNWDNVTTDWWNQSSGTDTTWVSGSDAYFLTQGSGAAGTVTLVVSQTAGNLWFQQNSGTYTITGSSSVIGAQTLTLSRGTVNVNGGDTAVINNALADTGNGLTLTGGGALVLASSYNSGLTGPVTVSSGTLYTNSPSNNGAGELGYAKSITIQSGAVISVDGYNGGYYNAFVGGGIVHPVTYINQGGLLAQTTGSTTNISDHVGQLVLDGGTVSAVNINAYYPTWNFDGGVATVGDGRTSYIVGGNIMLTQHTLVSMGGAGVTGTIFNVAPGTRLCWLPRSPPMPIANRPATACWSPAAARSSLPRIATPPAQTLTSPRARTSTPERCCWPIRTRSRPVRFTCSGAR